MSVSDFGKCEITVVIDGEETLHSGGSISGVATLQIQRHTVDTDALRIRLFGAEKASYRTVEKKSNGQQMTIDSTDNLVCCSETLVISFEAGGLEVGTYKYPFNINIPSDIPSDRLSVRGTTLYSVYYRLELSLEKNGAVFNNHTFKFDIPIRCMPVPNHAIAKVPYQSDPSSVPIRLARLIPIGQMSMQVSLDTVETKRGETIIGKVTLTSSGGQARSNQVTVQLLQVLSFPDDYQQAPWINVVHEQKASSEAALSILIPIDVHPSYQCRICTLGYQVLVKVGNTPVEIPVKIY
eukprot:gene26866-32467_t